MTNRKKPTTPARKRDAKLAGKRVLIVNDTQEILELFEDILKPMGLDPILMSFAPRELERIRETKPDLIILDFVFGEKELMGWQLLQKLKMDRTLDHVPVVVCTAALRTVSELEGYLTEQGVVVIVKPFNVDQLEEAVRNALTMHDQAGAFRRRDDNAPSKDDASG
ncbi:MAG TPA: response regulator [Candidatus Limnocylindria bacterium]|nr:response regulator [Candidatus Limnocylindria bacterium]